MLVSKKRLSSNLKHSMKQQSGYREKDIINNANFVISANKGKTLVFYKKHKKDGKYDHTKYDTCAFDLKRNRFIG